MGAASALACVAAWGAAGCGGEQRQDENERSARYEVEVVTARFPVRQKLAERSELVITVRNADRKTIPNIAVSVEGFGKRSGNADLADPQRPVFVPNSVPRQIGGVVDSKEASPEGGETAYVNTWALGRLRPGRERTFRWSVTAVKAGRFRVAYTVSAGLDGKARAVAGSGEVPRGSFSVSVSDKAPRTRVADDGETVVEGTR